MSKTTHKTEPKADTTTAETPTVNIQITPPPAPAPKVSEQTLGEQAAGREALAKYAK